MELDKLARIRAKQRNNKIAKKYPLFADQFATTVEKEKERIACQHAQAEKWIEKERKISMSDWERGMKLREVARQLLSEEKFAERERSWQRWFDYAKPEYDGHKLVTHWWNALRGTEYAFENCPHKDRHYDPEWWRPREHLSYSSISMYLGEEVRL